MENSDQTLALLRAWVCLSGIFKNSRFTKGLSYNESIIMLHLYDRWLQDGIGQLSMQELIQRTGMLKSLANRTVNALEQKELLERCRPESDRRKLLIRCRQDNLHAFLKVHDSSISIARSIEQIIGPEDSAAFIRIVDKICASGFRLKEIK